MMWIWVIFGVAMFFLVGLILGGTISGHRRIKRVEYKMIQGVEWVEFLVRHKNDEVCWHAVELGPVDESNTSNNDTNP